MTIKEIKSCIVIGSGPAGYTASIYLARAMLKPILITGYNYGGQLMMTTDIENFPGYSKGISGKDMMKDFHEQAEKFGTEFIICDVKDIDLSKKPYKINLTNGEELLTHTIIIATGAKALWLNAEGEKPLRSNGISTCAVCDGAFFQDEKLVVVGGGDLAMEDAIYLTKYSPDVTIIHRRDVYKASKIMLERAQKNPKISFKPFREIKKWLCDNEGKLYGALLIDSRTNDEEEIKCSGAFIAIGHTPSISFLKGQIETDINGYIIQKENTMTSIDGVFSAGDVSDRIYKQAITASGSGCQSAMDVEKWLEKNELL